MSRFEQPELRRLRAMKALELRLAGVRMNDIAAELNCSIDTVQRYVDWARREGLTDEYEARIISNLVPKAIRTYEKLLDSDDPFVAKDVIDKLIKLGDRYQAKQTAKEEQGLAAYIAAKKDRAPSNRQKGPTSPSEPAIDVTVSQVPPTVLNLPLSPVGALKGNSQDIDEYDSGIDDNSVYDRLQPASGTPYEPRSTVSSEEVPPTYSE